MRSRSARTRVKAQEVRCSAGEVSSCVETAAVGFCRSKDLLLRLCDSGAIGGHFQGKNDANGRAASNLALGLDAAAVQLGDMFHNRQPEAGAAELTAAGLVRAIKSFKNSRQIFLTNSDAIVAHAEHGLIAAPRGLQADLALLT